MPAPQTTEHVRSWRWRNPEGFRWSEWTRWPKWPLHAGRDERRGRAPKGLQARRDSLEPKILITQEKRTRRRLSPRFAVSATQALRKPERYEFNELRTLKPPFHGLQLRRLHGLLRSILRRGCRLCMAAAGVFQRRRRVLPLGLRAAACAGLAILRPRLDGTCHEAPRDEEHHGG